MLGDFHAAPATFIAEHSRVTTPRSTNPRALSSAIERGAADGFAAGADGFAAGADGCGADAGAGARTTAGFGAGGFGAGGFGIAAAIVSTLP